MRGSASRSDLIRLVRSFGSYIEAKRTLDAEARPNPTHQQGVEKLRLEVVSRAMNLGLISNRSPHIGDSILAWIFSGISN